jgi:carbonic anhydrase/acetyltransferase-like protein (isoleucine patch superfamily)
MSPTVHPSARVAPSAILVGDVRIGPETAVLHGAVLTAESGTISVGRNSVIMENAVLRSSAHHDCVLGDFVMVGPHCHLVGCRIEDEVFAATGASVFNGALVKKGSELRINSVVHVRTVLNAGSTVPIGWIAVGDPAKIFPPDKHEEIWGIQEKLDSPGYVFNEPRASASGEGLLRRIMRKYSRSLIRGTKSK